MGYPDFEKFLQSGYRWPWISTSWLETGKLDILVALVFDDFSSSYETDWSFLTF